MKKKDVITGTCIDYTHECLGVVRHDNTPIFVKNMIVGETARIEIIKVLKNYCVGRIVEMLETSPQRVEPICDVFKLCGGCSIMHLNQQAQQQFKTKRVKDTLLKIGHIDIPVADCLMDEDGTHYRNKVQVPFGIQKGEIVSGFYRPHTNDIINHDYCHIQNAFSNQVTQRIKELIKVYHVLPYDKVTHQGALKHVLTRYGINSHEGMVVFITAKKTVPAFKTITAIIVEEFPEIKTVIMNYNPRKDNVILGDEELILYGNGTITDTLLGNTYEISMKSFYQIHPHQVEKLYRTAIDYASIQPTDIVIDAYCGIGTITLSAAPFAQHVYGVEVVSDAIENAKKNAKRNQIDNVSFICQDAGEFMVDLAKRKQHVDVLIVDPPRKGCSTLFLEQVSQLKPDRIVYISCNVATQARDLHILEGYGYQAVKAQPVDLFPHTYHVECVVLLSKVQN